MRNDNHLPDEVLTQLGDGELPARHRARANRHLAGCWECRARKAEIERTIGEFIRLHHAIDEKLPTVGGPRALLKARLNACADEHPSRAAFPARARIPARRAFYACALILAFAGVVSLSHQIRLLISPPGARAEVLVRPNSALTPGAIHPVDRFEICGSDRGERDPNLPPDVRRSVFKEYGMPNAPEKDYEVDYLIAPELGGTSDLRNLWPEPYSSTIWNATAKDALEDRLHELVCEQKLDLGTAQHELATDWISAYKKYFHTQRPDSNAPAALSFWGSETMPSGGRSL